VLYQLRIIALLEGSSFLVLLFIAMPLKYLADAPLAVRIVGSVHGLLFLMFMAALYRAARERDWPLRRSLLAFVSSIVPFATFVFDRSLRREIAAREDGSTTGNQSIPGSRRKAGTARQ
jgi:integral membrane protein